MPILNTAPDDEKSDWIDPDTVPRPVLVFGATMPDMGIFELELHRHRRGQLIYVQQGALSCEVEGGLWIVPPRSAIWIPGDALHAIRVTGPMDGFAAFVDPEVAGALPALCCAVSVTPLLRELLARTAHLPALYEDSGANARLVAVLLDEMAAVRIEDLHLPMPADTRLRRIIDAILETPAKRMPMADWARQAGMSERTLVRLIHRETGMSFGRWRQQLGVMLAVKWLAGGASIQQVAADLGYESVPSFVTMFRKALGTSPGRYMLERRGAAPRSAPS